MDRLLEYLWEAPIVEMDEYDYFVHPVTDCLPLVEPAMLREIAAGIQAVTDLDGVDKIFTAEAMGIHHATALSLATDVPFVAARKRRYGFESEVAVHQETGYGEAEMYVNFVEPGDKLLIVDDVLATGGTFRALHSALVQIGAEPVDAVVVFRKVDLDPGPLPMPVKSLVDVELVDGSVQVVDAVDGTGGRGGNAGDAGD